MPITRTLDYRPAQECQIIGCSQGFYNDQDLYDHLVAPKVSDPLDSSLFGHSMNHEEALREIENWKKDKVWG